MLLPLLLLLLRECYSGWKLWQELDLRVGVAFTRFQCRYLQGRHKGLEAKTLSYGPCQAALHALRALHALHAPHALHALHALHAPHALHALHALHAPHALHALHALHLARGLETKRGSPAGRPRQRGPRSW